MWCAAWFGVVRLFLSGLLLGVGGVDSSGWDGVALGWGCRVLLKRGIGCRVAGARACLGLSGTARACAVLV